MYSGDSFIVPTLLRGEELYTQMGFFCSENKHFPIDIIIDIINIEICEWYH